MFKIQILILALLLGICPILHATTVTGRSRAPASGSTRQLTTPTGLSGYNAGVIFSGSYICWLKVADDGTNLTLSYSFDGVNYLTALTQARTTFLTPDHIGFGGDEGRSAALFASLFYWNIA